MFLSIFKFELKYWLKQPSVYVFSAIFFVLGLGIMAGYAGLFDEGAASDGVPKLANSPFNIHHIHNIFKELLLIILPIIIGQGIYRDFDSGIHNVFYSFPFKKTPFLLARFTSSILVVVMISAFIGIGATAGTMIPGVNPELLAPFSIQPYALEYLVFIIPNALFYGMIVFIAVALTRNVYSGFIAVIGIVVVQQILGRIFISMDNLVLFALFDPFGHTAVQYYTHTWTMVEQNRLLLPVDGLVFYNRLTWFVISAFVFVAGFKMFSFTQGINLFNFGSKKNIKHSDQHGRLARIDLPLIRQDFSFGAQFKMCWRLSIADFKYILNSGPFMVILIIGFASVLFTLSQINPPYATKLLPTTWLMLMFPLFFFLIVVNLLTFLYAGMLVNRSKAAKMNQLLDASPVSNTVLLVSKFLALVKMQIVLLALVAIAGILVQTFNGYFDYKFGLYLFHLFVLNLVGCVIWACLAMLVQTIFTNPYLGLFLLIIGSVGVGELQLLGIESALLKYNQNPDPNFLMSYSDMGGYGAGLVPFLAYKFYWLFGGLILLFVAWMFWVRGITGSFSERLFIAKNRINGASISVLTILIVSFLTSGFVIYSFDSQDAINDTQVSQNQYFNEDEFLRLPQPRITDVRLKMDIYPDSRDFKAIGEYVLVNKTGRNLDSIIITPHPDVKSSFKLNNPHERYDFSPQKKVQLFVLRDELLPNDTLILNFEVVNYENTPFKKNSPIEANGTFLTSHMFAPKIGFQNDQPQMPDPGDSLALQNMYRAPDADFINFEAIVGTSKVQTAIAPGYLQRTWIEGDRKYFHYKSSTKVTNDYVFNSGVYDVYEDDWKDPNSGQHVDLAIYHHPSHTYNLERMMNGLKAGLDYNAANFAPYQHQQARIVEYSRSLGNYGQSYANTLPLSEYSFVADIDLSAKGNLDKLYGGIAHEIAHQWWGHQAIPAGAIGYAMVTESMSEYVALKVIEKEYGLDMLRTYTRLSMEKYLKQRSKVKGQEHPLMDNHGQDEAHVAYEKGSLAMYALSDYLGEKNFNAIVKAYMKAVRFKKAPYTTGREMAAFIKEQMPDSLKYLAHDLFETVTLYDNQVIGAKSKEVSEGEYEIEIEFKISKFRSGQGGQRLYAEIQQQKGQGKGDGSLPLKDYIELAVFTADQYGQRQEDYLKKHLITESNNKLVIRLDKQPTEVAVDPYFKLIDTNLKDNFIQVQ